MVPRLRKGKSQYPLPMVVIVFPKAKKVGVGAIVGELLKRREELAFPYRRSGRGNRQNSMR